LETLFAEYVGPMAEILIEEHINEAKGFDDFLDKLLSAIPSQEERTDFRIKVKQVL